jgi:hypothetical protein
VNTVASHTVAPTITPRRPDRDRETPASSGVRRRRAAVRTLSLIGLVGVAIGVAGCRTEFDESLVTSTTAPSAAAGTDPSGGTQGAGGQDATGSTLPSGTTDELLTRLEAAMLALSGVMIAEGDDDAALVSIEQLWTAARAGVSELRPDLVIEFERNLERVRRAVEFERAADADKAARNVTVLVDTILGP